MSAGLKRLVTCAMIAGTVALATDAQNSRAEELIKADQILNALVPGAAVTRSLSGPRPETTHTRADQLSCFAAKQSSKLTCPRRASEACHFCEWQTQHRCQHQVRLQFRQDRTGRHAGNSGSRQGPGQSKARWRHVHGCWSYGWQRERPIQSKTFRATGGSRQDLSRHALQDPRGKSACCGLRENHTQERGQSVRSGKSSRSNRQYDAYGGGWTIS